MSKRPGSEVFERLPEKKIKIENDKESELKEIKSRDEILKCEEETFLLEKELLEAKKKKAQIEEQLTTFKDGLLRYKRKNVDIDLTIFNINEKIAKSTKKTIEIIKNS